MLLSGSVYSKGVRENLDYTKTNQLLKLTAPLSKSERLLLICFGYEMSAADGEMDARERRYLELIGERLINPRHLAVLEAVFSRQGTVDTAALDEVHSLLDPSRFHELDTVFVNAASNIVASFPGKPAETQVIQQQPVTSKVVSDVPPAPPVQHESPATQQHRTTSYPELEKFQRDKKQLVQRGRNNPPV